MEISKQYVFRVTYKQVPPEKRPSAVSLERLKKEIHATIEKPKT